MIDASRYLRYKVFPLVFWIAFVFGSAPGREVDAAPSAAAATVALVALDTPGPGGDVGPLPSSIATVPFGGTFFLEVWAQTTSANGLAQVSADIAFDPAAAEAVAIVHTAPFDLFRAGTIDNAVGLLDDVSGSHSPDTPPCSDGLGASPLWARLAIIEMRAEAAGLASFVPGASGSPIFVVSECGSFEVPSVGYVGASVRIEEAPANLELVVRRTSDALDEAEILPVSVVSVSMGETVFLELWAQAAGGDGFSQVSADISFDPLLMSVIQVSHTPLFNLFPSGTADNVAGVIDNLSGSHPAVAPPCSDRVGVAPKWVRVAVVEMLALRPGDSLLRSVASNDPVFLVAYCGTFDPPPVSFGDTPLRILPQAPAPEQLVVAKNRYLSVVPANPGLQTALRVTFVDLPPPFDVHNGVTMWVGGSQERSENSGLRAPDPRFSNFRWAPLQCAPTFLDWGSVGLVHISGRLIIPGATYALQAISLGFSVAEESAYSEALDVTTPAWGDTVGNCSGDPCTPPDGSVDVIRDVVAIMDKFTNRQGAIIKARADLGPAIPEQLIDISDAVLALDAFAGRTFPFDAGTAPCGP